MGGGGIDAGSSRSGYQSGLDRASDRLDRNSDRFTDRTGRYNRGLDTASDRLDSNRNRQREMRDSGDRDYFDNDRYSSSRILIASPAVIGDVKRATVTITPTPDKIERLITVIALKSEQAEKTAV